MNNEEEILRLLRENNFMLRQIIKFLNNSSSEGFLLNVLADMVVDTTKCNK